MLTLYFSPGSSAMATHIALHEIGEPFEAKPTLLHEECVFEAEVDRLERARSHARGRLVQNGVVTVEAEAVFARIGRNRTLRLGEGAGRDGSVAADGRTDPVG